MPAMKLTNKTNSDESQFAVRSLHTTCSRKFSPEELINIEETFPPVDPGFIPNGNRVLVQLRSLQEKTKGGLYISQQSQESALFEEQIGRVVAIGRSAFYNQTNMQPWPEGRWFDVGDFVRVPKFGGDKTWTSSPDGKKTLFAVFRDFDIVGVVTGNPLEIKGYI